MQKQIEIWWSVAAELVVCCRQIGILCSIAFNSYFCRGISPSTTSSWPVSKEDYCILFRVDIQKFLLELLYNISTLLRYLEQQWKIWTISKAVSTFIQMYYYCLSLWLWSIRISLSCASSKAKNIENIFRNKLEKTSKSYNDHLAPEYTYFVQKWKICYIHN